MSIPDRKTTASIKTWQPDGSQEARIGKEDAEVARSQTAEALKAMIDIFAFGVGEMESCWGVLLYDASSFEKEYFAVLKISHGGSK